MRGFRSIMLRGFILALMILCALGLMPPEAWSAQLPAPTSSPTSTPTTISTVAPITALLASPAQGSGISPNSNPTATPVPVPDYVATLAAYKDALETVKSIGTIIGIIVAGIWTYLLFIRKRPRYPRVKITHKITHRVIDGGKILLSITVSFANKGEVLLTLATGKVRVLSMIPWPAGFLDHINAGQDPVDDPNYPNRRTVGWPYASPTRERSYDWQQLGQEPFEVEPGVSDDLQFDFVLDPGIRVVVVYTYFRNMTKRLRYQWPVRRKGFVWQSPRWEDQGREKWRLPWRRDQSGVQLDWPVRKRNIGWNTRTVYEL